MHSEGDLMPVDPPEVEGPDNYGMIMKIPEDIRPAMQKHRIEVNQKFLEKENNFFVYVFCTLSFKFEMN